MKFQNPSFKFFLNGRTNGRTDGQAENNMLPTFSKFEAPSCYSFRDIMITNFQSPNLQREIIRKK